MQSSSPVVDALTMTVGQVIDKNTVQQIPLNGRHFLDLTQLVPGSVVPPANGSLTAASRGLGANSYITAGSREDSANFMINGVNLNDMSQNQITFQHRSIRRRSSRFRTRLTALNMDAARVRL